MPHGLQGPPGGPLNPGRHLQLETSGAPLSASVLCGQRTHVPLEEYVSRGHNEQGPPGAPDEPAVHRQAIRFVDAGGEVVLSGHREHSWLPTSALYSPALHASHWSG